MTGLPCPDDGPLMGYLAEGLDASAVKDHLDACPDCRERLETLRGLFAGFRAFSPRNQTDLAPRSGSGRNDHPRVIGSYLVIGVWGENDSVVSYRGLHRQLRSTEVILHLAREALPDDEAIRRPFEDACKALNRLDHPGISRAIDLDYADGRPFLAIPHISGTRLDRSIDQGTLSKSEALSIALGVAEAIASAHRSGVVHGSISASGVVINREDKRPILVDFGSSRLSGTILREPTPADRSSDLDALKGMISALAEKAPILKTIASRPFADVAELENALRYASRPRFSLFHRR